MQKIKNLIIRFQGLTAIGFANIISNAISGLFWLYMARPLGTENYGIVSYLLAIAGITTVISFIGSGNTLMVYTAKGIKIQPPLYFISIFFAAISSIVVFFLFHNIGVSLFIIGNVIFGLATSDLLGRKLYKKYSIYLISQKILMVGLSLAFYHIIGYNGVILGFALSFYLAVIEIYHGFKQAKIDFSLLKSRFGYIVNSYIMDLSRSFSSSTDKLIVAPMLGFALLGNYQLGVQILSVLSMLPGIVFQYTLPHDATGNSNKKLKQITILSSVVLAILGIILAPILIPVMFPKFTEAIGIVQIMSLAVIPTTITLTYISKFLGNEKIRIVLVGSGVFLAIQISMIVLLGKIFGINGVAASFVLAASAEVIYLFIVNHFTQKKVMPSTGEQTSNSQVSTSTVIVKPKFLERNVVISLFIIGAIGLFLRIYYFPHNIPLTLDALNGYFFYATDTSILGHLPIGNMLPNNGWPVFLSVFFSIFHFNNYINYMELQRLVSISLSVLTIIPVYLLCKKFFDKAYAVIGAAIFAFEPRIIQNSLLGITDPLYILVLSIALVMVFSSNKKIVYCSFGIIAIASLVRAEGLVMFVAFSIIYFIRYRKERKIIIKYLVAVGIFVLLLLPMSIFRIESSGSEPLTHRVSGYTTSVITPSQGNETITGLVEGAKTLVSFLPWVMIPVFMFFVPVGTFMIFKKRNQEYTAIIIIIIMMLFAAFVAYFSLAPDTRYLYPLFPLFCVLSLFPIKSLANKFIKHNNIFLILIVGGILLSSSVFLDIKRFDYEHQKEAFGIAQQVVGIANGVNTYYPEDSYIKPAELPNKWPTLTSTINFKTALISDDGFGSLPEYINSSEKNGLTHLVLDGQKNRPSYLNDVFYHPEKYPYLVQVYDSSEHGFKYHVKIFKIDYSSFHSLIHLLTIS